MTTENLAMIATQNSAVSTTIDSAVMSTIESVARRSCKCSKASSLGMNPLMTFSVWLILCMLRLCLGDGNVNCCD